MQRATRTKQCGLQSLEKLLSGGGAGVDSVFPQRSRLPTLSEPVLEPLLHGLFFLLQCFISSVS